MSCSVAPFSGILGLLSTEQHRRHCAQHLVQHATIEVCGIQGRESLCGLIGGNFFLGCLFGLHRSTGGGFALMGKQRITSRHSWWFEWVAGEVSVVETLF